MASTDKGESTILHAVGVPRGLQQRWDGKLIAFEFLIGGAFKNRPSARRERSGRPPMARLNIRWLLAYKQV